LVLVTRAVLVTRPASAALGGPRPLCCAGRVTLA
jgi:hypothetical protein